MLEARGKVVDSGGSGTRVQFQSAACGSCQGCGDRNAGTTEITLPSVIGNAANPATVSATLSTRALIAVMTHSLGLPVAGFVFGAGIALLADTAEGAAVLLSLLGFSAGFFFCRHQQMDRIQIAEVTNE